MSWEWVYGQEFFFFQSMQEVWIFACLVENCPIMRLRVRRKFQLHGGYVSSLEEIDVTRRKNAIWGIIWYECKNVRWDMGIWHFFLFWSLCLLQFYVHLPTGKRFLSKAEVLHFINKGMVSTCDMDVLCDTSTDDNVWLLLELFLLFELCKLVTFFRTNLQAYL